MGFGARWEPRLDESDNPARQRTQRRFPEFNMFRESDMRNSLWSILAVAAIGCSSESHVPEGVELHPAGGKVTYKGQPVEGATVTFRPSGQTASAVAMTNADGTFQLRAFPEAEGAVAGDYTVTVVKRVAASENVDSFAEMEKRSQAGQPASAPPAFRSLVPEKYSDPEQSGLKATVAAEGENQFEFALTD